MGTNYTVSCAAGFTCQMAAGTTVPDIRGLVWDPHNSTYYYGSAPDSALGDFGTAVIDDNLHTITLTPLVHNTNAHDVTFDPFTNDVLTGVGPNESVQRGRRLALPSYLQCGGNQYRCGRNRRGSHLFGADNNGHLIFVDYDVSKRIGAGTNFFAIPFLKATRDDIAQFVVPRQCPSRLPLRGSARCWSGSASCVAAAIKCKKNQHARELGGAFRRRF